jgi:CheY-like chemotaxis protein
MNSLTKKILIVDDSLELRELLGEIVKNYIECVVIYAKEGCEAFSIVRQTKFDLILSDLDMPCECGLTLLSNIRTVLKDSTPFVMVSGSIRVAPDEVLARGANGFVQKPFELSMIEAILAQYI